MENINLNLTPSETNIAALMAKDENVSIDEFVSECVRYYLLRIPNAISLETFAKTDAGLELNYYKNSQELFDKLGI